MANSDYGAIPLTLAESTSEALNTKLGVTTGFKPSEWPAAIASIPTGSAIPACGYTLFKDGEFYNTGVMGIEPTTYTIEDGMIKIAEQSINGFVVSNSVVAEPYIMVFTYGVSESTSYTQCGRCVVGGDLSAMVQSGTGRYSYNNSSSYANEERTIAQRVSTGGQGVFLSIGGVEAYIREIAIFPADTLDVYNS